jgi:outer membrane cobalamin receptor
MKIVLITTILSCCLYVNSNAQNIFKGIVIDKVTNAPIESALIEIESANSILVTNRDGSFEIKNANETVEVSIMHTGYKKNKIVLSKVVPTKILLEKGAITLADVVIKNNPKTYYQTISNLNLQLKPVKSAQDLLKAIPGLFIAQHQGGGKAEQIFLRGFDIDHGTDINISVDGLPVNMVSHAHGQGYADMHFIIPELVKTIDYGKGPYNAAIGNLGTAGYVNVQTVDAINKNSASIELGQFNTARALAMVNLLNNSPKQNAFIAGEFIYSDGPFESKQHFNRFNIVSKFNTNISKATNLQIANSFFKSKWDASGQIPERAVAAGLINRFGAIDNTEAGATQRHNSSIRAITQFNNNQSLEQQLYASTYQFKLFSNFTYFLNNPTDGDQIKQAERRNIYGYNAKAKLQLLANPKNSTLVGLGFRHDNIRDNELSNTKNKTTVLNQLSYGNVKELNAFAYAQQNITVRNFLLQLGARVDYFTFDYNNKLATTLHTKTAKAIVSPKIQAQYTLNKAVTLFAKSGIGFHSNDARVSSIIGAQNILPKAIGTDIGATLKPIKNLLINISAWHLYLQNELVYVGDEAIVEPSGKTQRTGIDVSAHYQINKHIILDAAINMANPKSLEASKGENYIPLAPTLTSTGGLTYKSGKKINGNLSYRYIKDRAANEDYSVTAKGYTLMDATVNYTHKNYEFGVSIENLLNTKWNEAQFNTTSRLQNEPSEITELHFTPGTPFFAKLKFTCFF